MNHTIPALLMITLAGGIMIASIASIAWTRQRVTTLLARWAAANGYQVRQSEPRYLRCGPYFWRRSRSQVVYHVTVTDPRGWPRSGYVRLGGWFLGLLSDHVDVTWDT
jgi:hypothetical protein